MDDQRFIAIETKILHQEMMLDELHQVLYQQQDTINLLQKKLKKIEEMALADQEIRPAGEKPPHY